MNLLLPFLKIVESIAYNLPKYEEHKAFSDAVLRAAEGKDLSAVHWAFLAGELRAIRAMLDLPKHIQALVDEVIAGIARLAAGEEWHEADAVAYDAANAAHAASAAGDVADYDDAADAAVSYAIKAAAHAAAYAAKAAADDAAGVADAAANAAAAAVESASYVAAYTFARRRQGDALLEIIDSAKSE